MKFLALVFAAMLLFVGCKKSTDVGCELADKAAFGAATSVAMTLECKNVDAIKASLMDQIKKFNLCVNETPQGMIGDLVCPKVVDTVVDIGLKALPTEWECKGGTITDIAKTKMTELCKEKVSL